MKKLILLVAVISVIPLVSNAQTYFRNNGISTTPTTMVVGDTCQANSDCGTNEWCIISDGNTSGICITDPRVGDYCNSDDLCRGTRGLTCDVPSLACIDPNNPGGSSSGGSSSSGSSNGSSSSGSSSSNGGGSCGIYTVNGMSHTDCLGDTYTVYLNSCSNSYAVAKNGDYGGEVLDSRPAPAGSQFVCWIGSGLNPGNTMIPTLKLGGDYNASTSLKFAPTSSPSCYRVAVGTPIDARQGYLSGQCSCSANSDCPTGPALYPVPCDDPMGSTSTPGSYNIFKETTCNAGTCARTCCSAGWPGTVENPSCRIWTLGSPDSIQVR